MAGRAELAHRSVKRVPLCRGGCSSRWFVDAIGCAGHFLHAISVIHAAAVISRSVAGCPSADAMSYLMPHLNSGWAVDQAILSEEDRLVCVRFGHDYDPTCMQMDEVLYSNAELVKNFAVIYLVDTTEVPDFNTMYELYDPCTVMFFFRNKHIMIDLGTGNNNKITWPSLISRR